ncbi:hypothetical protein [Streptomyces sp. NPDC086147]|uniref:hypothetical protein n=1 Tax=Streptomyces sp. NPDC086147 TaxID=3155295 RepID=UPI00344E66CF
MKKPIGKSAVAAGAAAAALVLTAAPASAVPSTVWTVTPSPVAFSAKNAANLAISINGVAITCTTSSASGTLQSSAGNPATVGVISSIAFGAPGTPCTSVLGNMSMVPTTPWTIVARDHTAATGVTKGHVGGIDIKLTWGACVFRVRGTSSSTYTNATGKLSVAGVAGELPVVASTNCGAAMPVGASLLLKADLLLKKTGTTTVPTIVGTNP